MKITIDEKPSTPQPEYPRLMGYNDAVVMFDKPGSGMVIKHWAYPAGSYEHGCDMSVWKPFTGSVTLSND